MFKMLYDGYLLAGIGIGRFKELVGDYIIIPNAEFGVHNIYFNVLFEVGVIGLALFLLMIGKSLSNLTKKSYLDYTTRYLQQICFVGYTVILVGGITKHDHYSKLFFVFIGLSSYFYFQRQAAKAKHANG